MVWEAIFASLLPISGAIVQRNPRISAWKADALPLGDSRVPPFYRDAQTGSSKLDPPSLLHYNPPLPVLL